jgi:nucleoside-diphosphate-sugar epimerase
MNKKILITGATGFIGHQVAVALNARKFDLCLIVRPGTSQQRLGNLTEKTTILEVDLRDIKKLRELINQHIFDAIIHIGAIRNREQTSFDDYLKANVQATEQFAIRALDTQAKFIYFSSVGVFGTVPEKLPADETCKRVSDNNYHYSKNQSEHLINKYVLYGLKAAIIRPVITYGPGDNGFPYSLIDRINKKIMFLPRPAPEIHLGNVDLLVQAVQKLLEMDYKMGVTYNIGDSSPVNLLDLADYISNELHGHPFNRNMTLSLAWFRAVESIMGWIRCKTWQQRFQLFGRDWYYDVEKAYEELNLKKTETIPAIRSTIEWYKKTEKRK